MGNFIVERDWQEGDLRCVVIMTTMGHRCGYVGLPKSHPLHGVGYAQTTKTLPKVDPGTTPVGDRGIMSLFCISHDPDEDNPYAKPEYYFDVHGSITFSQLGMHLVDDTELWWYGFDCAHLDDTPDIWTEQKVADECIRFAKQLEDVTHG